MLSKKYINVDFLVRIVNRIMRTFDYSNAFTLWKMKKIFERDNLLDINALLYGVVGALQLLICINHK